MIKLSKLTDYATVIIGFMGRSRDNYISVLQICRGTQIQKPTVAKVLKILASAGLVQSLRGAQGGYKLVNPVEDVALIDIIEAVEGPVALTECVSQKGSCVLENVCEFHGRWGGVNEALRTFFAGIPVTELMRGNARNAFKTTENLK